MKDISCTTENRQQSSSREFRRRSRFHSYSLHRKRCVPKSDAGSWKRPLKSKRLSIRPPELGTSNVSGTRFVRSSLPLRSSRQWRCRRKPSISNVRRAFCRVKETSRAKSIRRNEEQQDCDSVELLQFKIPAHMLNRSSSAHEINKDRENQRGEELQQIRS